MEVVKNKYGSFLVPPNDLIPQYIKSGVFHDEFLQPVFDKYITKASVVLDVGAHCGFYTVYFASRCAKVYAFEPQIMIFRLLSANLYLNKLYNVEEQNIALYHKNTKMSISPEHSQGMSLEIKDGDIDYEAIGNSAGISLMEKSGGTIIAKRLDDVDIPEKIDFIKIDAQGCDYNVLVGGIERIKKDKPVIIFEYEWSSPFFKMPPFTFFERTLDGYHIEKINANNYIATPQ